MSTRSRHRRSRLAWTTVAVAAVVAVVASLTLWSGGAAAAGAGGGAHGAAAYPLDTISRTVPPRGRLRCPKVPLTTYRGDVVRYHHPVRVFTGFVPRLRRFEEVVRDVAVEIYGRAPRRIVHLGTYNCRRIAAYPEMLSEHALGNGIDVAGFDFGRLPRGVKAPAGMPSRYRHPFSIRLAKHWDAKGRRRIHGRFLRELARRLIQRPDIFRVLLGPGYPGHRNHFHFDCGPYRYVAIGETESGEPD